MRKQICLIVVLGPTPQICYFKINSNINYQTGFIEVDQSSIISAVSNSD